MLKNHVKIAWRNFRNHTVYSSIIVMGLTVGLCASMLIATVVIDDFSYDKSWSRVNDLYRIITVNKMGEGLFDRMSSSYAGLSPELKKNFPEVEQYVSMQTFDIHLKTGASNAEATQVTVLQADTSVWKVLDIPVLAGNPKVFISGTRNLVISESFRKKWFPKQNPVGKTLYNLPQYSDKPDAYFITGVMKDLPVNSHLRADVMVLQKKRVEILNGDFGTYSKNYLLMRPQTDMNKFTKKVNTWFAKTITKKGQSKAHSVYEFQSVKDVYLRSDFDKNQSVQGSIRTTYVLAGVAVLLLFVACVNFINLSTSRAVSRMKETGVRKILGAGRKQLMLQFLTESILYFFLSGCLALVIYQLSLRPLQAYIGHSLSQNFLSDFGFFLMLIIVVFILSLFTGMYPAWLLSGFNPASSLKKEGHAGSVFNRNIFRKSLVVIQYSLSLMVLLAMLVIRQQMQFLETKDIGYKKDNLFNLSYVFWGKNGTAFKNELLRWPGVENASIASWTPSLGAGYMSREVDDPSHPGNKVNISYISGDIDFAKTLGLEIQSGRLLENNHGADAMNDDSLQQKDWAKYEAMQKDRPALITALTAKQLGVLKLNTSSGILSAYPVGIIRDFHNESLHETLKPTVIFASRDTQYGNMLLRIKSGAEKGTLSYISRLWKRYYPNNLYEPKRVVDMLDTQYASERKLQQLFSFFSVLSIFLAALGVFGLVVYATQQRVKEIGIRKVLGASAGQIVRLLSGDFVKLVFLAVVIASPLAYFMMKKWLQDFAYRIEIPLWVFAVAAASTFLITFFTISFQAIKAALANPVKSLRSE